MEDKITLVRSHILGMLERGELGAGGKLPGARDLLPESGIALPVVQNAIESLVREGVLETIPRRGTFVQQHWDSRILQQNLTVYRKGLHWLPDLQQLIRREIPEVWVSDSFSGGTFEILTTHYVQAHHDRFLDLTELFNRCFPDQSDFFSGPFEAFRVGSRLVGIPIIFSPRVIFYNPVLFDRAGCPRPRPGWSYAEFLDCVRRLRRILPPQNIFLWEPQPQGWINFVQRTGGCLIDSEGNVRIDSPETRRGLKLFRDLRHEMGLSVYTGYQDNFVPDFLAGNAAMLLAPREFRSSLTAGGFNDWETVSLPEFEDGVDVNVQAADAFCVRRNCVNLELAERLLKLLLSPEHLNCLARWNYGLPIRKSIVGNTISYTEPRDVLFLSEIPKMQVHYNLNSAEIYDLVCKGIANLMTGEDDIDTGTAELAAMVRVCQKIQKQTALFQRRHQSTLYHLGEVS